MRTLSAKAGAWRAENLTLLHKTSHKQILSRYLFYLDDGICAGPAEQVAHALGILCREGAPLGLHLNVAKCELIVPSGSLSAAQAGLFPRDLILDSNIMQGRARRDLPTHKV